MKNEGALFIILGATGDLTKRKLVPAIYNLIEHEKIKNFHLLAVSRRGWTSNQVIRESKKFIKKPKSKTLSKLKNNSSSVKLDFQNAEDYKKLKESIDALEKKGFTNKIFYMATSPNNFELIANNLSKVCLEKNSKIVFEKPFGLDLKSAIKLNNSIKSKLPENQIYRIDHYLGKELAGNISIVRFSNVFLEPIWNNKYIDSIQISIDEKVGIDERGPYYDKYGAIKDMVQNHMLQLLALTTMEEPKSFSGNAMRDKKSEVLKKVKVVDTFVAQYEGYKNEKGIPKDSKTETFAALKLAINNSRWKGVPIFLRTGKHLGEKKTRIVVKFKKVKCLFETKCPTDTNYLVIEIYPNEGIYFEMNVKTPGEVESEPKKMEFCHSCEYGPKSLESYENLFMEIVKGDQSVFTREDELMAQWKVTDSVKKGKLHTYKKGKFPNEFNSWSKKHKVFWK